MPAPQFRSMLSCMNQHPNGITVEARASGNEIRRPDLPARSTGHTTETPPGSGLSVARQLLWPYHNLVDPYNQLIYNLIPWDKAALSLKGSYSTGGTETNHAGRRNIQWAIVGYASRMQDLGPGHLRWLAEVFFEPMLRINEIPNRWSMTYGADQNIILASINSPIRMSNAEWEGFSGVTYHQQVPGQDHWDAGKLDYANLQRLIENDRPTVGDRPVQIPGMFSVLGFGDTGVEVERLQTLIRDFFPAIGEEIRVNGKFSKQTQRMVRAVQRELGVRPDGYWGPKSANAFETWRDELAEAIVNGIKPDTVSKAERIRRNIDRQDVLADELVEKVEALEKRIAVLYKAINQQNHPMTEGLLADVQQIKDDIVKLEKMGDNLARLTK